MGTMHSVNGIEGHQALHSRDTGVAQTQKKTVEGHYWLGNVANSLMLKSKSINKVSFELLQAASSGHR
uniref:Uncharacterized protein n=1 Tax=Anguilla anguilla TaxID=7936 RepID=A0A0E9WV16_ANGAN